MQYSAIFFLVSVALAYKPYASEPVVPDYEPAAAIYDNPIGVEYKATFEGQGGVNGYISFLSSADGSGVDVSVELEGFAGEVGPFGYHIHDQPVPADGNCTGTKAHLDPYGRGQTPVCDKTMKETCEVGDLAGKYGKIPDNGGVALTYSNSYNDLYASNKPGIGAFLGNRSIVIHRNDTTRLACVNILGPIVMTNPLLPTPDEPEYPTPVSSLAPISTGTGPIENTTHYPGYAASSGTAFPAPIGNTSNNTLPSVPAEPSLPTYVGSAAAYSFSAAAALGGLFAVMLTL